MRTIVRGLAGLLAMAIIISLVPAAFSQEIASETLDLTTTIKPINEIGAYFNVKEIYDVNKYVTIKPVYDVASYFKVKEVYDVSEYSNVKPIYEVGSYYKVKDLYVVGEYLPDKPIFNIGTEKKPVREI